MCFSKKKGGNFVDLVKIPACEIGLVEHLSDVPKRSC
jgi:hypothetical protein